MGKVGCGLVWRSGVCNVLNLGGMWGRANASVRSTPVKRGLRMINSDLPVRFLSQHQTWPSA